MTDAVKILPKKNHSILPDVLGILSLGNACILFFSLVSYSSADMLIQAHGEGKITNWVGPGGALVADTFLYAFGVLSYVFPIIFGVIGIACFWRRRFWEYKLAISGGIIAFLAASTLLQQLSGERSLLSFPIGGIIGRILNEPLLLGFSHLGAFIVALSIFLLGLVMLTQKPLHTAITLVMTPFKKLSPKPVTVAPESSIAATRGPSMSPNAIQIIKRDNTETEQAVMNAEAGFTAIVEVFELPPLKLLDYDAPEPIPIDERVMRAQAERLEKTFGQFGIEGHVREIRPGPVVTMFEFVPAPGIKLSRIAALADDIAMAMTAIHVRVVAPIPGKGAVGIEIPNEHRETVYLKEIVAHPNYRQEPHPLCMAIGKTIEGKPYFLNLAEMPHVLIAGTTGSGKSVSVNAMICSILYRATPDDVRFLMIDPKMLELSIYEGIPHLLLPPIIDSKKAAYALKWAVKEMDRRYLVMNELGVRDIEGYNEKVKNGGLEQHHVKLPFIVTVVDEYADLVIVAGKDVESYVMRLAQKARACGIHVMLATQRPSVDIITGVIKANFPVRMSFRLAAAHDSKTIINRSGAEKLLGRGDMLMIPPGSSDLIRIHGAFVSEKELVRVIDFWKKQAKPNYDMSIVTPTSDDGSAGDLGFGDNDSDEKYADAVAIVQRTQKCSTSWLQRQLGIGYNRAARLVEQMEREGVVGPILNAKGDREIFGQ